MRKSYCTRTGIHSPFRTQLRNLRDTQADESKVDCRTLANFDRSFPPFDKSLWISLPRNRVEEERAHYLHVDTSAPQRSLLLTITG